VHPFQKFQFSPHNVGIKKAQQAAETLAHKGFYVNASPSFVAATSYRRLKMAFSPQPCQAVKEKQNMVSF
jgi:hypothetical protein